MQVLRDRIVILFSAVTLLGMAFVAAGWIIQGTQFLPGLLLEAGASLMLLVPLALLGLMLENRMRHAEEQIRITAAQLNALSAATREQLGEQSRRRSDLYSAALRNPTQALIRDLLSDAVELGAVDPRGIRIRLSGTQLRARFATGESGAMLIRMEQRTGVELGTLDWPAQASAESFATRLSALLVRVAAIRDDYRFDPSALLQRLVEVLQLAVRARTADGPYDVGPVIEIPNAQWAVSVEGLFSLQRPYHIPADRLGSGEDWRSHLRGQQWVDGADFDEAYRLARSLLSG